MAGFNCKTIAAIPFLIQFSEAASSKYGIGLGFFCMQSVLKPIIF